jgi:hypothetical protein
MRNHLVTALLLSSTLAGCSTLGPKLANAPVSIGAIIQAVRCELASALPEGKADGLGLAAWGAVVTLTLKLEDTGAVTPGLTGVKGSAGDFEWKATTASTKYEDSVKRNATFTHKVNAIRDVKADVCPAVTSASAAKGLDLGLWLSKMNSGMDGAPANIEMTTMVYDVAFTVTATAGGGLSFKTAVFSASLDLNTAQRLNSNTLKVAFIYVKDEKKRDALVDELESDLLEEEKERETTIVVAPGQIITIQ